MASVSLLLGCFSSPPCPKPYYSSSSSSSGCRIGPSILLHERRRRSVSCMSYSGPTPALDRVVSALSYTLPLFNSVQYGRFLFMQYPRVAAILLDPLVPMLSLYKSVPYASFVAFFGLYLGVVRNPRFSQYVRFNAMQAVTLDVLLAVPMLIQRILSPGRAGIGFNCMVLGHNAVFILSVVCFIYSLGSTIMGRTPYLPFVADAAGRQL